MNLSDRIWRIDKRSRQEIERILKQAFASGKSASDKTVIAALENLMNPSYTKTKLTSLHGRRVGYEGSRLLRTSMAEAFSQADKLSASKNPGFKGLNFLAASGCCEICTENNGKDVKEVGYPPAHPNCRCTTEEITMSTEQWTDNWIEWMRDKSSHPELSDWYENVYRKVA